MNPLKWRIGSGIPNNYNYIKTEDYVDNNI
jgi:hypothetical protein